MLLAWRHLLLITLKLYAGITLGFPIQEVFQRQESGLQDPAVKHFMPEAFLKKPIDCDSFFRTGLLVHQGLASDNEKQELANQLYRITHSHQPGTPDQCHQQHNELYLRVLKENQKDSESLTLTCFEALHPITQGFENIQTIMARSFYNKYQEDPNSKPLLQKIYNYYSKIEGACEEVGFKYTKPQEKPEIWITLEDWQKEKIENISTAHKKHTDRPILLDHITSDRPVSAKETALLPSVVRSGVEQISTLEPEDKPDYCLPYGEGVYPNHLDQFLCRHCTEVYKGVDCKFIDVLGQYIDIDQFILRQVIDANQHLEPAPASESEEDFSEIAEDHSHTAPPWPLSAHGRQLLSTFRKTASFRTTASNNDTSLEGGEKPNLYGRNKREARRSQKTQFYHLEMDVYVRHRNIAESGQRIDQWSQGRNHGYYAKADFGTYDQTEEAFTINQTGLYNIYTNITYVNNTRAGYSIKRIRANGGHRSLSKCIFQEHGLEGSSIPFTCYSSIDTKLIAGDKIYLNNLYRDANIYPNRDMTYWGIIKLP